jgi:uncharacterized protein (TIGR02001 family)
MKKIKLLLAALTLTTIAPLASAEVSVTGTLISDYVFRGVSQTDSSPAIQASLDYEHESGFFAGAWATNVDFEDDADTEIDFYAGYFGEINDMFSYDVMYNYYTYQGYSSADDSDYGEFLFNAYIESFTLGLGYTSDYINSGDEARYVSVAYDIDLPSDYALTLQAGYTAGDAFKDAEYTDYSATVAKTFYDFDFTAAVINTDVDDSDTADFRFVLGVARTF